MGYMRGGTILRIDLNSGSIDREPTADYEKLWIGARGLNSRILYTETDPTVNPLGPENVLMFSLGPFTGTMVPGSGRVEVAAKSPVIGIQGMGNMGGYWGPELKYAGYDSVIVKGKAANPVYIAIQNDEVEIRDATHLWGLDTYRAQEEIWGIHGRNTRVMTIGVAGEKKSRIAIILTDTGDASGQCGFGGVMGSKNLKAIAARGTGHVRAAKPKQLMEIVDYVNNLFARKSGHGDPFKPEEPGFKYNIWGGGYGRGSLGESPGELMDLVNDPSSG